MIQFSLKYYKYIIVRIDYVLDGIYMTYSLHFYATKQLFTVMPFE